MQSSEYKELYNLRRRAQRAVVREEKFLNKKNLNRREAKNAYKRLDQARQMVTATYAKTSSNELRSALAKKENQGIFRTSSARGKNANFQKQIESYLRGDTGFHNQDVAKIFMSSTRRYWEGGPVNERVKRIANAIGNGDLKTAWENVLKQNKEALKYTRDDLDTDDPGGSDTRSMYDYIIQFSENKISPIDYLPGSDEDFDAIYEDDIPF